jgi:hypothetical protein
MAGFIQNMIWSSVEGFVDAAKKTGGEYAGNALIKVGDTIENSGRSVGGGTSLSHPSNNLPILQTQASLTSPPRHRTSSHRLRLKALRPDIPGVVGVESTTLHRPQAGRQAEQLHARQHQAVRLAGGGKDDRRPHEQRTAWGEEDGWRGEEGRGRCHWHSD